MNQYYKLKIIDKVGVESSEELCYGPGAQAETDLIVKKRLQELNEEVDLVLMKLKVAQEKIDRNFNTISAQLDIQNTPQ